MTPESLKACPFCGECPEVNNYAIPMVVYCKTKSCVLGGDNRKLKDGLGEGIYDFKNKYFIFSDWNTRAPLPALEELRDALTTEFIKNHTTSRGTIIIHYSEFEKIITAQFASYIKNQTLTKGEDK